MLCHPVATSSLLEFMWRCRGFRNPHFDDAFVLEVCWHGEDLVKGVENFLHLACKSAVHVIFGDLKSLLNAFGGVAEVVHYHVEEMLAAVNFGLHRGQLNPVVFVNLH